MNLWSNSKSNQSSHWEIPFLFLEKWSFNVNFGRKLKQNTECMTYIQLIMYIEFKLKTSTIFLLEKSIDMPMILIVFAHIVQIVFIGSGNHMCKEKYWDQPKNQKQIFDQYSVSVCHTVWYTVPVPVRCKQKNFVD